uniref:Uncharacterized protein n=1 Tax=Oryza glumipatula TaxID=40148 RepID=A0A0D9ZXE0_9ORYZ
MSSPDPATSSLDLAAADLASSDTTATVAGSWNHGSHYHGCSAPTWRLRPHDRTYKFHTQAKAPFSAKQAETYRQKHLSPHRSTRPERRQLKP